MLLRLPWLLSRKRLLAAVVIDSCLFSLLYIAAFLYRFGSWPGLSFPVGGLVTFWLLSSYVIGRYQLVTTGHGGQLLSLALRTGVTLSLSLGVYLAYFWVTAAALGARDSRGFLVPLLLAFAFFSNISQSVLIRVIHANT